MRNVLLARARPDLSDKLHSAIFIDRVLARMGVDARERARAIMTHMRLRFLPLKGYDMSRITRCIGGPGRPGPENIGTYIFWAFFSTAPGAVTWAEMAYIGMSQGSIAGGLRQRFLHFIYDTAAQGGGHKLWADRIPQILNGAFELVYSYLDLTEAADNAAIHADPLPTASL
jgi:hypothetical protein